MDSSAKKILSGKKIWALLDERQGNTSQTVGVTEALGAPFETKKIEFNELTRLPNFLINNNTIYIKKASRAQLAPPWPDIVICCARRLGIVASYIKSQNPSTFVVQIQWPGFPSSQFDLIAAPKHDNAKPAKNVFVTIGAPNRVTESFLKSEAEHWRSKISALPSLRIAVLIGGDSRSRKFNAPLAKQLAISASNLANSLGGSLLITTSRRTSAEVPPMLREFITAPHYIHYWSDADAPKDNPFYGFLGLADAVIATGESTSMCSEACGSGKPVFIFSTPEFVPSKLQEFNNDLIRHKLAKPLLEQGNSLFTPPFRLDDSSAIAAEILKRLAKPAF